MAEQNDLLRRIGRVADAIDPGLTDRDVQRLVSGAQRRARRRTVRRLALGGLGIAAAAVIVGLRFAGGVPAPVAVAPRPAPVATQARDRLEAPRPEALRLADGSVATPLDPGTALAVRESSPQRVTLDLARGRGRFEVTPRPARQFVVRAGDVTVTVLGTVFTVERVADRIGVVVERGTVLVDWRVGSRRLVAGENGWFPPLMLGAPPSPAPRVRPASRSTSAPPASRPRVEPARDAPSTEPPAVAPAANAEASRSARPSRGEAPTLPSRRAAAPTAPPSPPARAQADAAGVERAPEPVRETAASLLVAADAARLDGRPADAAALLRRLLREHGADPRAPLAAFTLGRVLLRELDQPLQAAAAFAEARALAPRGPFAEDALAREVEAWNAAGETTEAAARARDYLRRYPDGRRAAAMRAVGGE